MQYTVDSERFNGDWNSMMQLSLETGVSLLLYGIYISLFLLTIPLLSRRRKSPGIILLMVMSCIMAVLGTAQIAVTIAQTVVQARFVQQDVQAPQGLNEDESESISRFSVFAATRKFIVFINKWLYRCYMIWGFRRKVVITPALLMLSTFGMGIVGATVFDGAAGMTQITFGLAAATNLVLTALTGNRYNIAIGLKLESGAIYCIGAIFLIITVSLHDSEIYDIGIGITQQLMVSSDSFRLI
ncbi:hypothetical protein B0H13DRAFT_2307302 [Mycena leptocephala]|nr:hypothetical protein B0H13DRAFT_2307302 [Mycena leptocephala]